MKNLLFLPVICLLSGCAAGINHNVVSFNDKPYLVETKTYAFLMAEWSTPSTVIPLGEPLPPQPQQTLDIASAASEQVKAVIDKCRLKDGLASRNVNYRRLYKCVVEELAAFE